MPFTDVARTDMLRALLDDVISVRLGFSDDEPHEFASPAAFDVDADTASNREEITFPRWSEDAGRSLTHWFVYGAERMIAYDKLERPILLRKGERATFAPGALRLELR